MIHTKVQHTIEALLIGVGLLQPISLIVLALPGAVYYISMLKMNVVDQKHGGGGCGMNPGVGGAGGVGGTGYMVVITK